jgi:hypothetical protein
MNGQSEGYVIVRNTSAGVKGWIAPRGPGKNRTEDGWTTYPASVHVYATLERAAQCIARQRHAGNELMTHAFVAPASRFADGTTQAELDNAERVQSGESVLTDWGVMARHATAPAGDHDDDVPWSEVAEQAEYDDYLAGKEWERAQLEHVKVKANGNGTPTHRDEFQTWKKQQVQTAPAPAPRQTAPDPLVRQQVTQWMDAFLAYQKNADDADDSEDREYWLRRANVALTKVQAAQQVLGLMGLYVTWPIA